MNELKYCIRHILPNEMPAVRDPATGVERTASVQELLNLGIHPLGDDYYSCAEQYNGDEIVIDAEGRQQRVWRPHGPPLPGRIVSAGTLHERHVKLAPSAKARILRAHVYRATNPLENAKALTAARVQARALARVATPLTPGERRAVELEEAAALADDPTNSVTHMTVPMGDVNDAGDVVIERDAIPHHWQGER